VGVPIVLDLASFNEAAALHCGKRFQDHRRPRGKLRFNEAAALHCGKLLTVRPSSFAGVGFNEAAALHCGKLDIYIPYRSDGMASMRPQLFTAENQEGMHNIRADALVLQ